MGINGGVSLGMSEGVLRGEVAVCVRVCNVCAMLWGPETPCAQSRSPQLLGRTPGRVHLCFSLRGSTGDGGVVVVGDMAGLPGDLCQKCCRRVCWSSRSQARKLWDEVEGSLSQDHWEVDGDRPSLSWTQQSACLVQGPPLESGRRCSLTPKCELCPLASTPVPCLVPVSLFESLSSRDSETKPTSRCPCGSWFLKS